MANSDHASGLGPVVFFGLSAYMLVMGSPVEPEYLNPSETMDMAEAARVVVPRAVVAPFPDMAPRENPPGAPLVSGVPELGPAANDDRIARAQGPAPMPARLGDPGALRPAQGRGAVEASIIGLATPFPDPDPKQRMRADLPNVTFEQSAKAHAPATWPTPVLAVGPMVRPAVPQGHRGAALRVVSPALSTPPRAVAPIAPDQGFASARHEPVRVTGNAVNLRVGPDISFASRAKMRRGARAVRVAISGDWSLIQVIDQRAPVSGWMASEFLAPLSAP